MKCGRGDSGRLIAVNKRVLAIQGSGIGLNCVLTHMASWTGRWFGETIRRSAARHPRAGRRASWRSVTIIWSQLEHFV